MPLSRFRYSCPVLQQVPQLSPFAWALLALAALLIGVSKTAIPGINTISIAIFAAFLPPKASTAAILLLLIVGDVFALVSYRRHAKWRTLLRLIPAVALGLAAGALFLAFAEDSWVRRVIGAILLLLIAFTLWQRRQQSRGNTREPHHTASGSFSGSGYGTLGGFTTMVANAGGPVMAMYFLSAGFPVKAFLGTAAWFFAVINIVKLPIMAGLGLFTREVLTLNLLLVPLVVIGSLFGRWIASRIQQRTFEYVVVLGTVLGALYLLV